MVFIVAEYCSKLCRKPGTENMSPLQGRGKVAVFQGILLIVIKTVVA